MKKHERVKHMRDNLGMKFSAIADEIGDMDVANVKNLYRYKPTGGKPGIGPAKEKRELVVHYRDVGNLGWAEIGRLIGGMSRQSVQAMYQRAKEDSNGKDRKDSQSI